MATSVKWHVYRLEPSKGRTEHWPCANRVTAFNLRDALREHNPDNCYVVRYELTGTPIVAQ